MVCLELSKLLAIAPADIACMATRDKIALLVGSAIAWKISRRIFILCSYLAANIMQLFDCANFFSIFLMFEWKLYLFLGGQNYDERKMLADTRNPKFYYPITKNNRIFQSLV